MVSYPRDTSSTSNHDHQYTPAIIPCDRIHLRIGVSPPPGIIVTVHALPPQFLLALTYIETLITEYFGCGTKACGASRQDNGMEGKLAQPQINTNIVGKDAQDSLWNLDDIVLTPPVFSHMIEQVCVYLWKTDIPALVKEYVFIQLAQSVRIFHYSEGCNGTRLPTPHPHLNPSHGLLVQLQQELKLLYEFETKDWETVVTASGTGEFLTHYSINTHFDPSTTDTF